MDRVLFAVLLIVIIFSILIPWIFWINSHFNSYDEFDELEDGALVKLEMKKLLMGELQRWISENNLTKEQIGERLMMNRKRTADIIYQRVDRFTVDTLVNLVLRTGKKISLLISDQ